MTRTDKNIIARPKMNLQSFKGTPDSLKLRSKGFERKLSLGAPDVWPRCPVDATRWRSSQAGNTSSPSVFSVVEMGSLLYVYAINLPRKILNTKGSRISFHSSSESQR